MDFEKKDFDSKQRFGIRKLTVGVCSVLLSTLLLTTVNNNQTVHAATENGQQETDSDQGANADRGLNIVKESTTSTSQAGSETDTNEKKDTTSSESAQVQTSGVESAQKSDENSTNVENSATDTKTGEQKITTDQSKDIDTIQKTEPSKSNSSSTNETTNEEKSTTTETESEQTNTNTLNVKNTAKTAVNALAESKVAAKAATTTNGGYDSATWGTLDLSNWTGQNTTFNGTTYYQLTGYTGDTTHIIVPNEEDFELAGKSTNGNQVAISKDLIGSWKTATSIAFSKTDDKKIKLVSTDLNSTFQDNTNLTNLDANSLDTSSVTSMNITFEGDSKLSSLTGISDWDVSNVTAMTSTFRSLNGLSSLTGLENWDVSKVTNMDHIFSQDNCSNVLDLSAISNWKTSSVQNLTAAFANNRFTNLHGLENWDVSKVTTMGSAFMNNGSLTDISAVANWKTSSLTDMNRIFNVNQALTSLHGLENWDTSKVTNFEAAFANEGSLVDASAIANWNTSNATNMRNLFANSGVQYLDFSKWDFSKVTRASDVVRNVRTVVYFGDNATITANNLNTLGFGKVTNPIILASGALYTLLSGSNTNTHTITINNSNGSQLTTISVPVVYDASSASNATEAINSYKEMVDNKIQDYATANNYALKFVSAPGSTDDLTGHNNHLINYAEAKYQVVTVPTDQKKDLQVQDKTVYKGSSLTAKDLVTNSADFPEGTTFEFADNTEPNLNQLGTYDVKIAATYPVTVNGQQYTAVSGPVTAKVTVTDQMQFNIIYWDDTENKEIVKFDIQNAGNDGYSNNLKFPAGVETGNYQSVSVSGVPTGVTIAGNYWNSLDNSSTDWTVPNYKWTAAAAPSLYGANIVIHLAHRTTETTEQQTRQVTVNYVKTKVNEDGTYTEDGNAFDSAVLDVYYTRTATTDKVTGKTTYGAWKWDTSKGDTNTPGYHVVSGTWTSLPSEWANVTAEVPTLNGYTAYTGGPASNTNKVPANQFVFPSWNGSDGSTSETDKGSTAYTDAATLYEAKPVHTILYVPEQTEARTVTTKFVYAGGDKDGQKVASDTQIQVYFKRTGTINTATNKVTYGSWTWDKSAGDTDHPGFHIISGNWTISSDGQFSVKAPTVAGYTAAMLNSSGSYGTTNFATPTFNSDTVFTNNTASQWYVRNELTTYYVPNSSVNKTVVRTITITPPNTIAAPTSVTQTATINRLVRVNSDDTGVVYDGFNGSGWSTNTGSWTAYRRIMSYAGYTTVITQVVTNPDGTTTETKLKSIDAQTVDGNTLPTTINVTYTATSTAVLSGEASSTYNGQPISYNDINGGSSDILVQVSGPMAGYYTVGAGDLEFSSDGGKTWSTTLPTNAGTYVIQLKADQVKTILEDLISQDSNYSYLKGNLDLDKLQVAGQASYTINKKPLTVYLDGNSSAVYTGSGAEMPLQDLISHLKANGLVSGETLNTDTFDKADFQWYVKNADGTYSVFTGKDAQGNTVQTPINVGTYYIGILPETSTNSGIDTLRRDNTNYDVTIDYSKYYQFDITPAKGTLTLSGSQTDTYNGQAVSIKDGNYSISFGPVSGNQNSGVLSGDQTAFNAIKWDASDFEFVNGAPTNAGTYQVRLSSAGLQKLQDFANGATGSNYDFSSVVTVDNGKFTASSVTGNYTVNKNELTVSLTNKDGQTPSSVIGKYDLSAGNYTLTITPTETIYGADGKPITLTYDLKDSDLAYKNGTPSNIGTYDVQLTAAAVNDLEQKFGTANYTYKLSPSATHEITKGTGTITLSGGQTETYTGQPAVLNHHKYFVTVATNIYSDSSYLNAGDMQYLVFFTKNADGSYTQLADKPTDVGTYYVGLNDYMVKLLQDATGNNGENYNWSQNYATYVITAAKGTATGSFSNSSSYNAQPIGKQDITVNVTYPGAKSNTYTLQDGDYEYVNKAGSVVTDPTDAGTYTIRLTTAGENHIKQLGNVLDSQGNITKQNVDWTINFTGSYTINAVQMTVTVNGTQNETYDGNAKTINIGRANGVNVTISADGLTVPTIPTTGANALTADDFTIKDAQGNVVTNPTNAGTYKIYLNSKGLAKLGNLSANFIVPESLEQSADLIIARQDVNITEGSTGKTFDAQSAALTDEQFAQYKKAITDAGYNVDGLTVDGIDWWFDDTVDYGTQGNPTNPIKDIGTYNLRLNAKGQKELDDANPNYKLKVGDFKYTIYPEVVHIEVDGTQNADWDNQGVSIDPTKFVPKFVVYGGENGDQLITNPVRDDGQPLTLPAGVQLVPGDYEFVDDDGNVIKSFTRQDGTTSANPFKVGSYKVRLTEEGWKKLATQSTDNVKYQYDNSTGTLNINQITPDITLDGANWKTYDGQPVSFDELVSKDPTTNQQLIYVSVTSNGHTIYLPLDPGTYNWSSNGQLLNTAPSQVGTYTITLNKDRVIESLNNWMANNSDYKGSMKILADNIKGSALFEIRARNIADLVADPASGSQTYNGQTAQIDLSAVVGSLKATDSAGKVWKLNTSTLTLDDYTITDPNGNVLTGFPVNVGTYTFKINEKGIAALASANPNFTIPNEINGYSYTYTINQANASGKLDGTNFGTYTGKAITTAQVNSNGRIVVTVDYPGIAISDKTYTLQDGDYTWNTENGSAPTDVGKYTITLTKAGIANVENYILKLAGTGQEGKSNVVFADNAITGSATYTINKAAATISISDSQKQTMPWTGNPAKIDPSNFVPTITSDGQTIAFPSDLNLTSDDYEFVNDKGEVITAPSEIGTYMVRLTGNGWQKVRDAVAGNSNYTWTYEGQGSFEITKAEATVVLSGSSSTVYTGQGAVIPSTDGVVNGITVTVDGKSYNLTPDDLEFVDDQGNVINPVDAGSYKVRLKNDKISSITGLDLTHYNYNYSGNTVQFDITQMPLTITVSDKDNVPTVIYGESTTLNPSDYNIKVTDANGNIMDYTPVAGDLQFKDGVPTSSGTYEVILSDQGLKNIQDKFGTKNYTYTSAGQGSFIVNKATANVKTSGSYEATYDGKTPEIDVAKVINTITTNNGASLTVNNLTADDFEWVDADGNAITSPVNVGTYYLKLKDSSHSKIATNDNYDWSFSGLASVTINKANATIKFSGNDTVTYTGNKVAPTPDAFTVTLADGQTYKLTANDIQVIGDPVNVGTYQVELTQAGIDAINKANPNYNYSYDGSKGTLTIDPAQATATISGLQTSKQPQVDPKNYTVTVNGQTITGLTADDFIFSKDGHPVKLIEAGTYDVELSGDAIDKIRQANPNYNITFSSTAKFTLENSSQTINYVDGSGNVISSTEIGDQLEGTKVSFTPDVPAGWALTDPNNVPSEITISNGTTTIEIKHGTIVVTPDTPEDQIPKGQVPGDPDKQYEELGVLDLKPTRKIIITLPDGTVQEILQQGNLTRTATFDEVTGKITYSDWTAKDGKGAWDEYEPTQIPGYTIHITETVDGKTKDIDSISKVTVSADTQDTTINITYTRDQQPTQPTQPSDSTNPSVPTNPSEPTNPAQPTSPTQPGKPDKPEKPNKNKDDANKQNNKPAKPNKKKKNSKQDKRGQSNNMPKHADMNSRSPKHAATAIANKKGGVNSSKSITAANAKNELPQTGDKQEGIAAWLGLLLSSLGIFNLIGDKKRKKK